MNHAVKLQGFTLVELMLAMGFVSALLLAIAMTVIQLGNIYNTGLTYTNVNQAGSSLVNELQRSISDSVAFDISTDHNGNGLHYVKKGYGGRLCLGQYSYIWNYGKALATSGATINEYSGSTTDKIHFVKALDPNARYCRSPNSNIDHDAAVVELLDVGQHDLAIHYLTIASNTSATDASTGQQLYFITLRIGTNDQSSLNTGSDPSLSISNTACLVPSSQDDPSYCAVNQFKVTVRAGNAVE